MVVRERHLGSANALDDLSNALLLRTDLHIAFHKPKFVFVPKPSSALEKTADLALPYTIVVSASQRLPFLGHIPTFLYSKH
jgi:hypothetical protein